MTEAGEWHPQNERERDMAQYAMDLETRLTAAEESRYLGIACPRCGRHRLWFSPKDNSIRCDKCSPEEGNDHLLSDCNPVEMLEAFFQRVKAAEARAERYEQGLEEIANVEWRIIEGSIGPLMDVGYSMAGKYAADLARQALTGDKT